MAEKWHLDWTRGKKVPSSILLALTCPDQLQLELYDATQRLYWLACLDQSQ